MPKQPDERFPIPQPQAFTEPVLDLLGGVARPRPLSGEEAIRRLNEMEARARAGDPESQAELARRLLTEAPNARKNRPRIDPSASCCGCGLGNRTASAGIASPARSRPVPRPH